MTLYEVAEMALKSMEAATGYMTHAQYVRLLQSIDALRDALDEPDEVAAAVAAEREACAMVCEALIVDESGVADVTAWQCAAAIRARGAYEAETL